MADGKLISTKQLKIDKANTTILITVAVCSFLIVFSLIASKSLLAKYSYQNRIKAAMQTSYAQAQNDQSNVSQLVSAYNKFNSSKTNIIGGSVNSAGGGNNIGTNDKIIQDALPTVYDYPALGSSLENLMTIPGVTIQSIGGTVTQQTTPTTSTTSTTPKSSTSTPVPMNINLSIEGTYQNIQTALTALQNSIRPFQVQSINFSGTNNSLTANISLITYYLPSVGLSVGHEEIQ